jgi:hypothetical protein
MAKLKWTAEILQFDKKGEKTGWTYIYIPLEFIQEIKPGMKKTFRVKGYLDKTPIKSVAIIPMGEGDYILPINGTLRKALKKRKGYSLQVEIEEDPEEVKISSDLLECLEEEPKALSIFQSMPKSHQNYYSHWIQSAKTEPTRVQRIARVISSLDRGLKFGEMLREKQGQKEY